MKKIAIANDHTGVQMAKELKYYLEDLNYEVIHLGSFENEKVDYPDQAAIMAQTILEKKADFGILICGTGIGISIAANRHKGIYAAVCYNEYVAQMAKEHNNANVIVFGSRTMGIDFVKSMLIKWLNAKFQEGRHTNRIIKIDSN